MALIDLSQTPRNTQRTDGRMSERLDAETERWQAFRAMAKQAIVANTSYHQLFVAGDEFTLVYRSRFLGRKELPYYRFDAEGRRTEAWVPTGFGLLLRQESIDYNPAENKAPSISLTGPDEAGGQVEVQFGGYGHASLYTEIGQKPSLQ